MIGSSIAIRYSAQRPQFGNKLIMDYLSHQRRLLPGLAATYALHLGLKQLKVLQRQGLGLVNPGIKRHIPAATCSQPFYAEPRQQWNPVQRMSACTWGFRFLARYSGHAGRCYHVSFTSSMHTVVSSCWCAGVLVCCVPCRSSRLQQSQMPSRSMC